MFSVYSVCFWPSGIVYNNIQKYAWPDINKKNTKNCPLKDRLVFNDQADTVYDIHFH